VEAWDGERKTIYSRVQCVPASKFDKTSSLRDSLDDADKLATVLEFDKVLGLDLERLARRMSEIPTEVIEKNQDRERFREKREWEKADILRKELESEGYVVQDFAKGSILERTLASLIQG